MLDLSSYEEENVYDIFLKGFFKDHNCHSKKFLFQDHSGKHLYLNRIPNKKPVTESENILQISNFQTLNETLYQPCLYGLWSDAAKQQAKYYAVNYFKNSTEEPGKVDLKLDFQFKKHSIDFASKFSNSTLHIPENLEISKTIVAKIICRKELSFKPDLEKLNLSINATEDFEAIKTFEQALQFLNTYGSDYPVCEYNLIQLKVLGVEVSSYCTKNPDVLLSIGQSALEEADFDQIKTGDIFYEQKTQGNSLQNERFKYRFKLKFFKQILPDFLSLNHQTSNGNLFGE